MEAWKDSRIEGWKDGSAGGMEGWDGPSRPPYVYGAGNIFSTYVRVHSAVRPSGPTVKSRDLSRVYC